MTPDGKQRLKLDECINGVPNLLVYWDGTGKNIHAPFVVEGDGDWGYATIGYGRNLVSRGITADEAELLLSNDIATVETAIHNTLPWVCGIPLVWLDVLDMVHFNTGNVFAWKQLLSAMKSGDAQTAAAAILDSVAAREGPDRYKRMSEAILQKSWNNQEPLPVKVASIPET